MRLRVSASCDVGSSPISRRDPARESISAASLDVNYGRFSRSALFSLADYVNQKLKSWIMRKYKRFRFHKTRASLFLRRLARDNKDLFVHWQT